MKIFDLVKIELNRTLHAPMTWFFFVLISMCPMLGYKVVSPIAPDTTAAIYLANPFIVGGIGASFLFAFFSIRNLNRTMKNQMESILYSVVSPMKMHMVQVISLFVTGLVWTVMVGILYLPYTMKMLKEFFSVKEYIFVFCIYWGMAMTLTLLLVATFYNVWKRADAAIISVALICLIGLTNIAQSTKLSFELYFPDLGFSSDFGNTTLYRVALYSRGLWLCVFVGAWIISLLGIRVHGKNWLGSVMHNLKKSYLIVPSILLIGVGTILYIKQPYIYFDQGVNESTDDGAETETWTQVECGEEEDNHYELLHTDIDLGVDCKKGRVRGTATYFLENRDEVEQECRVSIEPGCEIEKMIANGEEMTFGEIARQDGLPGKNIVCKMPSDKKIELEIQYNYKPMITSAGVLYMDSEITPEYISLGNVSPFINETITDNSDYVCKVKMPKDMQVIVGGLASSNVEETQDDYAVWKIEGYGVQPQIFAGDYVEIDVANVDFPVHFYYGKNHQREFEKIDVEQMLQDTIRYCTNHYGSLPYTEEYPLNIVVANAHMMGGAAIENLSYMGETCFSAENLQDLQKGANAREVIAHEVIHQWWGIHAPITDEEDACWSGEAFTCYTTYRLMKDLYGEEYANKNYVAVWEKEYQDLMNHFYIQNPKYQASLSRYNQGRLESMITDANLYAMGPLELKQAADIIGEDKLDEALNYLFEECLDMNLFYISKQDFLDACELSENQISLATTDKNSEKQ